MLTGVSNSITHPPATSSEKCGIGKNAQYIHKKTRPKPPQASRSPKPPDFEKKMAVKKRPFTDVSVLENVHQNRPGGTERGSFEGPRPDQKEEKVAKDFVKHMHLVHNRNKKSPNCMQKIRNSQHRLKYNKHPNR